MSRAAQLSTRRPPLAPDELPARVISAQPVRASGQGLDDLAAVAGQLPDPSSLKSGVWIAFLGAAPQQSGLLARMLGRRQAPGVHVAVRCTALLLRGYEEVCADAAGAAFGRVPSPTKD